MRREPKLWVPGPPWWLWQAVLGALSGLVIVWFAIWLGTLMQEVGF